jgi:hypothetical protein
MIFIPLLKNETFIKQPLLPEIKTVIYTYRRYMCGDEQVLKARQLAKNFMKRRGNGWLVNFSSHWLDILHGRMSAEVYMLW